MYNFDKIVDRTNTNSVKWNLKPGMLSMWVADMDFEVEPHIIDAINKAASQNVYGYSKVPNSLFDSYKYWWETEHQVTINTDWMLFSNGVVSTISAVLNKIVDKSKILLQTPVYNCFYRTIEANKKIIISNVLIYESNTYKMDFIDLENKLNDNEIGAMILCNPHNPTGNVWSLEDLEKVASLCKKYNVLLICDEIHCDFTIPKIKYNSILKLDSTLLENVIVCVAPSKTFNIAGLCSSSVIVVNDELRKKVCDALEDSECANASFFAIDATIAAYKNGSSWVKELNEYLYKNKLYFYDYAEKYLPLLKCVKGEGTYLLWVDISKTKLTSDEFCKDLEEKVKLFVCPGSMYHDDRFVRINIATSLSNVKDCLNRLNVYFNGNK